jgi:hypothetical protein
MKQREQNSRQNQHNGLTPAHAAEQSAAQPNTTVLMITNTELSVHEMDDVVEAQHNLDASELDAAIAALSDDQLVVLREQCQESVERQQGIIARVNRRLGGN